MTRLRAILLWPLAPLRKLGTGAAVLVVLGLLMTAAVGGHVIWRGPNQFPQDPVWVLPEADSSRAPTLFVAYGCTGCHVVEGLRAPGGRVGPRLEDFRQQVYVAGVIPNSPENLVEWIQHPQQINPLTAMPNLDVTEQDARDIAAWLYRAPPPVGAAAP